MFRRRSLVLEALLLSLVSLAAGCNRHHRKVVAVIPKGNADIFWQTVHAGAVKAGRENNVEIAWNGPPNETDISTELQILESMINRRVDAIAIAPSDKQALSNTVARATRQKIPMIIYDSEIATDKYVSFIATDNFAAGGLAGERMGKILNGNGKIVMVKTTPGGASTTAREEGFKKVLREKYPGIQILDERFGKAMVATSLDVTENMLAAHPDVQGIFASNESGTNGAMQALRTRTSNIKLVGFDWSPTTVTGLRDGKIDSLVIQNPFEMGYQAVKLCLAAINKQPTQRRVDLAARLITQEDLSKPDIKEQLNPDLKKYLND